MTAGHTTCGEASAWRAKAPAKINLGLFVGPTRHDGRHELVSVMQSVSLADELALEDSPEGGPRGPFEDGREDLIHCPQAPALERDNLIGRALDAFRAATGWDPGPLLLTLDKNVPIAAGMGGGSGDAAAALRLAAAASGIEDEALLRRLAEGLGADVPAQLWPGRWLARGAGERLHELPAPRQAFGVAVLPLAAELSTAAVYAEADRLGLPRSQRELEELAAELNAALASGEQLPQDSLLANDLQAPAIALCPEIEPALKAMQGVGADVALISGSGPTVLGLFAGEEGPRRAEAAVAELSERHLRASAAAPVDASFAAARPVRNNDGIDLRA